MDPAPREGEIIALFIKQVVISQTIGYYRAVIILQERPRMIPFPRLVVFIQDEGMLLQSSRPVDPHKM